jgi:uncharacterized protein YjiS (DUF1127 family)
MSMRAMQVRTVFTHAVAPPEAFHQQRNSSSSLRAWFRTLRLWIGRSRQRRRLGELADLNDYLLRDIGVTRDEALRESAKPFWR